MNEEKLEKNGNDPQTESKTFTIGASLNIVGMVKASVEYTRAKSKTEYMDTENAVAGDRGTAIACRNSECGDNGLSVARGSHVRVRGGKGAILLIAEENKDSDITDWKAVQVDGEMVKEDTWYRLVEGQLVEAGSE